MNADENDLQKAIDDITRGSTGGAVQGLGVDSGTATVGKEEKVEEPVVPATVAPEPPTIVMTETPAVSTTYTAPAQEPVVAATADVAPAQEPIAATTAMAGIATEGVESGAAESKGEDSDKMDSESVRDKAIDDLKPIIGTVDLTPILSKVDLLPETKFKIFKNVIETLRDKESLPMAYMTAKEIANDEARAEALLYIVEMVDKLG